MVGRTRRGATRTELELLYRACYPRFLRVALAIVRDDGLAHDAVQDGFARALNARRSFDGSGPLEAWVWRIIVNAALAQRRDVPAADIALEAATSVDEEDGALVRRWVARLPERQRLVVFLRYYADLDYRANAKALEVEVGTVSATLSAAHTALRRQLKEVRQ